MPTRGAWRLVPLLLILAAAASCGPSEKGKEPIRVGVPPDSQALFAGGPSEALSPVDFVSLRPYERARDLEILLFSSRSRAFDALVVPGRSVPVLKPWLLPFPEAWLDGVRRDIASSLRTGTGAMGLPITADGALVVYRSDLWKDLGLPPPNSLAAIRDAALSIRSRRPEIRWPIVSDLPADQLFWGLAWSFEGSASDVVYSYPKLHALKFIQEFRLGSAPDPSSAGEALMASGDAVLLFTGRGGASRLTAGRREAAGNFALSPLPGEGEKAQCVFNGLCLTRRRRTREDTFGWAALLSPAYQRYLASQGWPCVLETGCNGPSGPLYEVFRRTTFHPPPDLGEGGDEAILGALLDATEGPMDAEAALRRAQARLQRRPS